MIEVKSYQRKNIFDLTRALTVATETNINTDIKIGSSMYIFSPWGNDNLFPQTINDAARKCSVLQTGLAVLGDYTYGTGIMTYKLGDPQPGKAPDIVPVYDSTIDKWMRSSKFMTRYLVPAIENYWRFGNVFPLFMKNIDKNKIAQLRCLDAPFCRWERMDKDGVISNLFYSNEWANQTSVSKENTSTFKIFPRVEAWNPEEDIMTLNDPNVTMPLHCYTSGDVYYGDQPWHAAFLNGWIEIAGKVPTMKKFMFENMMSPKFQIEINEDYWKTAYIEWDKLSDEEKKTVKDRVYADIDDNLHGLENTGKSIRSSFLYNMGNLEQLVRITPIDNKMQDSSGAYLPDSQQANSEILFALGIDPALIGASSAPGAKMGAGSGSDKREAMLLLINRLKKHRDVLLEPLRIVQQINGWDKDIQFAFKDVELTTLDKNPTGQQKTTQA